MSLSAAVADAHDGVSLRLAVASSSDVIAEAMASDLAMAFSEQAAAPVDERFDWSVRVGDGGSQSYVVDAGPLPVDGIDDARRGDMLASADVLVFVVDAAGEQWSRPKSALDALRRDLDGRSCPLIVFAARSGGDEGAPVDEIRARLDLAADELAIAGDVGRRGQLRRVFAFAVRAALSSSGHRSTSHPAPRMAAAPVAAVPAATARAGRPRSDALGAPADGRPTAPGTVKSLPLTPTRDGSIATGAAARHGISAPGGQEPVTPTIVPPARLGTPIAPATAIVPASPAGPAGAAARGNGAPLGSAPVTPPSIDRVPADAAPSEIAAANGARPDTPLAANYGLFARSGVTLEVGLRPDAVPAGGTIELSAADWRELVEFVGRIDVASDAGCAARLRSLLGKQLLVARVADGPDTATAKRSGDARCGARRSLPAAAGEEPATVSEAAREEGAGIDRYRALKELRRQLLG